MGQAQRVEVGDDNEELTEADVHVDEVEAALDALEMIDELEDFDGVEDAEDGEAYPVTRSGFIPCVPYVAAVGDRVSRIDFVTRSLRLHEALAELSTKEPLSRDAEEALRALADVCAHLDDIADRRPYARVLIGFAECLVDLGFAEYAERPLSEAIAIVDDCGDARLGAIGRRSLGRARLVLEDPSCRPLLEEALEMFDEAVDHVLANDVRALLRTARAKFLALPQPRPKLRACR